MPYPTEHAARLHAPSRYSRIRRVNDDFGAGIDVIYGRRKSDGKWEIQAIRFDKTKFTVAQAKKWLRDHNYKPIMFEPASSAKSFEDEYAGLTVEVSGERPTDLAKGDDTMPATMTETFGKELDDLFADPSKRTISKTEQRRRTIDPDAAAISCKAQTPTVKNGTIEGYASVFDVIDAQGEIVRKGAFSKTIAEAGAKLPLMIVHMRSGGDVMAAVAAITEMKEDTYGLWFKAEWLDDELSQSVRRKCLALDKSGVRIGASIGYKTINYGFTKDSTTGRTYVELRELALKEITVTLRPACEPALITSAKEADNAADLVPAFKPIVEAKTDEMSADAKTALLVETFGSVEKAVSFGNALKGIAEKTLGCAASEPQRTADADGGTQSTDSQAGPGKESSEGDAATAAKDAQRSQARRDEQRRDLMRRARMLANGG